MDIQTAQALIRFGLGRKGSQALPDNPRAWLAAQLEGPDPALAVPGATAEEGLLAVRAQRGRNFAQGEIPPVRALYRAGQAKYIANLLDTDTPFRERLVSFWANHFTVSVRRGLCAAVVHAYLREAIRPHVNGRFADMLMAVMTHPAMLLYLDNAGSIGPDSIAGTRRHKGLNENLARECLELHTVTPAAGYTQADVTAFANVLTGWSLQIYQDPPGFLFRPNAHEPGRQVVMGQSFPSGREGGVAALTWLAGNRATYRNLATKLVRHFVADTPPPGAVSGIEEVLRDTHGDLKAASLALLRLPEAWQPLTKLRSPGDYVTAVLRAVDLPPDRRPPDVPGLMAGLGQPLLAAPLPNGWPDTAIDWSGPEAMLRRVDWAYGFTGRAEAMDAETIGQQTLGPLLQQATLTQIRRAGSRRDAMTLLLASPEFQRR